MKYLILVLAIIFNLNNLYSQESPDNIFNNNLRNRGGEDAFSKIESIKMDMTFSNKGSKQNAVAYLLGNQAYRIEFIDNPKANEYILVNNNLGFHFITINKIDSVRMLTNQEISLYNQKMDILGPLIDYKNRGIDFLGIQTERCGNQPCKIVEIHSQTSTSPEPIKLYFTQKDELIKMEEMVDTDNGRKTLITEYSNYKPAKNSSAIFAYTTVYDGNTTTINEISINPEIGKVKMKLTDDEIKKYSKNQ